MMSKVTIAVLTVVSAGICYQAVSAFLSKHWFSKGPGRRIVIASSGKHIYYFFHPASNHDRPPRKITVIFESGILTQIAALISSSRIHVELRCVVSLSTEAGRAWDPIAEL